MLRFWITWLDFLYFFFVISLKSIFWLSHWDMTCSRSEIQNYISTIFGTCMRAEQNAMQYLVYFLIVVIWNSVKMWVFPSLSFRGYKHTVIASWFATVQRTVINMFRIFYIHAYKNYWQTVLKIEGGQVHFRNSTG